MKRRQLFRRATTGLAVVIGARLVAPASADALPGTGSAQPPTPAVPLDRLLRIVSLSHVNDPALTPIFPGDPEFSLETAFTVADDGFYLQYVKEGEHTGTHWGAPAHFQEGGLTADQLDPEDLFLPAVKIDIRDRAAADADYAVTVADLQNWEAVNGAIPHGAAVILWTGWASRWGTDAYANADADGVTHQPGFSAEAAQWLIDTGRLADRGALGTDTFGPDLGNDETYPVSVKLYDRRRISLENLTNLESIPTTGAYVLVGGPINRAGSGSPATIFGLIPKLP
ncbi:cyclase [Rhodococcus sp. 15-725-2-2b]|jgi:kynurenine formamidase|uniref:cyclase family protein n=1 Tax=unclassified Rhodococcus (in: high G+C Gram-positive bacteria) TaxID=192944 RepID=UPI000B9B338D|nr:MULTISPECIES: cyclase family protein [unclassified Rhodococcus (in: high G+C Gram-positive bacteria)]OZC60912.1 cyclase [Rhodococcus sp. 06-470-2]OZC71617.1 cyclase [Rhodococcus sp. 06-469-3-2]OZD42406.1 cyclase [Rhodococcus sp. 06-1477-1A]OZE64264.1 cyclase [Rhodococcus sp. 05-2221-1B]OZE69748.1 cyclase [Rhodococcus sp. 15-725-2-2b]